MFIIYKVVVAASMLAFFSPIMATPHHYCRKYIEEAARETGVLPEILWAVAKTESNYGKGAWPWTIDVQGKAHYFMNKSIAIHFLKSLPKKQLGYVDIGCMQLNAKYHGKAFTSLSKMMNPRLNVMYGAYFLKELYNEKGQWAKAVASYHSRNWMRGRPYAQHVAQLIKHYEE
jgi:soluble lytic murein transglycosylase-like protein